MSLVFSHTDTTVSELRRTAFARRLPTEFSELTGPAHGTISLTLHLAWFARALDAQGPR
ncbi:hypothetical protein [Streptomyces sp. 8N616]|uniref:hypothetical protein n=1 Tax=Streptomyces sp. 8N616 TaxID=3457414 RepID=UPI003FCEE94F